MRVFIAAALTSVVVFALAACGNKGALYLPDVSRDNPVSVNDTDERERNDREESSQ